MCRRARALDRLASVNHGGRPHKRLVQHQTQGVDVGAGVDRLAFELFGRHVLRRAQYRADPGQVGGVAGVVGGLGDAEIRDVGPAQHPPGTVRPGAGGGAAIAGQEDVGRLDVAVHDADLVRLGQRRSHLAADGQRVGHLQWPPLVELLAQGDTGHQLHDDRLLAVVGAGVVDGDDRGVVEAGHGDRLPTEALDELLVGGQVGVKHLHRDRPAQHEIGARPHPRHAADRQQPVEPVTAGEKPPGQVVSHLGTHQGTTGRGTGRPTVPALRPGGAPRVRVTATGRRARRVRRT